MPSTKPRLMTYTEKDIIEKFISRTTIEENECTLCRVRDIVFDPEYCDMVIGGEVLPFLN